MLFIDSTTSSQKRGAPLWPSSTRPVKQRRTDDARAATSPNIGLENLPSEMLVKVVEALEPNIATLLSLQSVSRKMNAICQDNVFWERFSPKLPAGPRGRDAYFQAFRKRMAKASKRDKRQLRNYLALELPSTTRTSIKRWWPDEHTSRSENFDVVRAFGASRQYLDTRLVKHWEAFKGEPAIAQYFAYAGRASLMPCDEALFDDRRFMLNAVSRNVDNYLLRGPSLQSDKAFEKACFRADGAMYRYAAPELKNDKKFLLEALAHWAPSPNAPAYLHRYIVPVPHDTTLVDYPDFITIEPGLRDDLQVQQACLAKGLIDSKYFRSHAVGGLWQDDAVIMQALVTDTFGLPFWRDLFEDASPRLKDDEAFALIAIKKWPARLTLVSQRLQGDIAWLGRAIDENRAVYLRLSDEHRQSEELFARYRHAGAIMEYAQWGANHQQNVKTMLQHLHAATDHAICGRRDFRDMQPVICRRLSATQLNDQALIHAILALSPSEFDYLPPNLRDNRLLQAYTAEALLQNLRHNRRPQATTPEIFRNEQIPTFLRRDTRFAKRYLLAAPAETERFLLNVKRDIKVMQVSRLSLFLMSDRARTLPLDVGQKVGYKLRRTYDRFSGDFLLAFAKHSFLAACHNWDKNEHKLRSVLRHATQSGPSRQRGWAAYLYQTFPAGEPTRQSVWRRQLFTLGRAYLQLCLNEDAIPDRLF